MNKLQDLLLRYRASKETAAEVEAERRADQSELIEAMHKAKETCVEQVLPDEGVILKGTLVEAQEVRIDYAGLWDVLTPKQRKAVQTVTIDKDLLEAAVVQGDIPAELVEDYSELYAKAPYVRLTTRKAAPAKRAPRKKVRR